MFSLIINLDITWIFHLNRNDNINYPPKLISHVVVLNAILFRDNLDPFRGSDDLKIWNALAKCHVEDEVKAMGGLDIQVKESGTSFSVGQCQLLCLARAFLKSSKVK